MLTANETVAERFYWLEVPFIYRVHEEPDIDKVKELNKFLSNLGYKIHISQDVVHSSAFSKVLEEVKGKPEEKVVSNLILRTLKVAKYESENLGHFGIASKYYCHFTSPIRRYPDLLVHRLMKQFLFNHQQTNEIDPLGYFTIKVHETGLSSSASEKTAENLERSTVDMKKCEYMEKYIGNVFTGMISSVVNWGLYVTLDNTVEGLVRFDDLPHDYYEVDETAGIIYGSNKSHVFKLGDIVRVKLIDVNPSKKQITFRMMRKLENE